jgi:hypothetical protein
MNETANKSVASAPADQALEAAVSSKFIHPENAKIETIFNGLAKRWRDETSGYSLTNQKYAHPAYQSILALGPEVVPLILRELQARPGRWLQALKALNNGFDPSKPGDSFDDAVKAWLEWGRKKELIS